MTKPLLLTVVGQTATGKTKLALELAKQLLKKKKYERIALLSADSKQVYQGLEILSGADIPKGFEQTKRNDQTLPFFIDSAKKIELHGVSCIPGKSEWSAAHFQTLFAVLQHTASSKTAIIIVGGTGLYHQQLFAPAQTLFIPPNEVLRTELQLLSVTKLQKTLQKSWPERWKNMNYSDRYNPRRLIRAIEVALSTESKKTPSVQHEKPAAQFGLLLSTNQLQDNIQQRVEGRIERGVIQEVGGFELRYPAPDLQAKFTLGYAEIREYLHQRLTLDELKTQWVAAELRYAKQQHTWWKKQTDIQWFDAAQDVIPTVFENLFPRGAKKPR
jgi:tRNA dimethylallyltransferase